MCVLLCESDAPLLSLHYFLYFILKYKFIYMEIPHDISLSNFLLSEITIFMHSIKLIKLFVHPIYFLSIVQFEKQILLAIDYSVVFSLNWNFT